MQGGIQYQGNGQVSNGVLRQLTVVDILNDNMEFYVEKEIFEFSKEVVKLFIDVVEDSAVFQSLHLDKKRCI